MFNKKTNASGWKIQLNNRSIGLAESHLMLFFVMLFSGLYLVRDLLGVYFPDIVFSGICAIAFLVLSNGAALGVYIFTTALTVPHNEIMLLYIAVFCLKQVGAGGIRFHKGMFMIIACLMVLQMVDMTLFAKSSFATMVYDYITLMLYIIIPVLWCMVEITPRQYRDSMLCYMWGALLGACIVAILTAKQVGWSSLFSGNQYMRLGATENVNNAGMQSSYNANQLSGMMAITVSMALVLMEKKKLNALIGFVACSTAICVVALTKSRTGFLCTGGAIGLYIMYSLFVNRKVAKGLFFIGAIVGFIALLLYIEPEFFDGLMSRFEDQEDITNGRSDLFVIYLQEWLSNPWVLMFGYGIKSFQNVVTAFAVPHNAIADILISWGLTGFILIVGTWGLLCREAQKNLSTASKVLALCPFVVALVYSLGGQYLSTGFSHTRLCFLLVSMQAFADSRLGRHGKL